jgi:hypothetical protein
MIDKNAIATEEEWEITFHYKDGMRTYNDVVFMEERSMGIRLFFDINGNHIKYVPLYNVIYVDMKKIK